MARIGTVYTETVVFIAPERFAADVPYQIIITELNNGERLTARVAGERVAIGDRVVEVEPRDGIPYFKRSD